MARRSSRLAAKRNPSKSIPAVVPTFKRTSRSSRTTSAPVTAPIVTPDCTLISKASSGSYLDRVRIDSTAEGLKSAASVLFAFRHKGIYECGWYPASNKHEHTVEDLEHIKVLQGRYKALCAAWTKVRSGTEGDHPFFPFFIPASLPTFKGRRLENLLRVMTPYYYTSNGTSKPIPMRVSPMPTRGDPVKVLKEQLFAYRDGLEEEEEEKALRRAWTSLTELCIGNILFLRGRDAPSFYCGPVVLAGQSSAGDVYGVVVEWALT
eukprot:gnl/Dysnectes_brevis/1778_a2036_1306.p1 GENE.gnl/Dysnectes_brevis/1778_a2036_1306~~gnl/Dysnectes_brevis/1778_a2036_1306.p1  ORF type:complete len:264 (+),score=51.05 gnl/Dysnectes_brevis/1778_a2036_1306:919-1710(+)